jgi:hypothetical protein
MVELEMYISQNWNTNPDRMNQSEPDLAAFTTENTTPSTEFIDVSDHPRMSTTSCQASSIRAYAAQLLQTKTHDFPLTAIVPTERIERIGRIERNRFDCLEIQERARTYENGGSEQEHEQHQQDGRGPTSTFTREVHTTRLEPA